jgi:hypothetical protein
MLELLSSHLRRVAFLYVLATKPEDIPDIMKRFVKFLKEESDEDFESTPFEDVPEKGKVNIPLTLNDKAFSRLKEEMSPYPGVIKQGILPGSRDIISFLNVLGQFLTNISILLESPSNPENEPWVESLYKIWGTRSDMSARGLAHKYTGQKTHEVKSNLISKLNDSIKILSNHLSLQPVH